jgi:pyruvate/2-oxoglutarate dehydrogenase complex dihydrolipoamide dehydrogenase (E3) component
LKSAEEASSSSAAPANAPATVRARISPSPSTLHRPNSFKDGRYVLEGEATPDGLVASFEGGRAPASDTFDRMLVTVGRRPNGRLIGVENAGVRVDERGFIPVDKQQRANVPDIFAIGDTVGLPMLAHKAVHEGKVAAETAAGRNSFFDTKVIPSVANTDPEVAWVGMTENEARQGYLPLGRLGALALARPRRGHHQALIRRGDQARPRLRHRRPQCRRSDRRGGASHRDGRGC